MKMKNKIVFVFIVFISLVLILVSAIGCQGTAEKLTLECKQACYKALDEGKDLSNGPCLLDPMSDNNWVCDVAHKPREAVDNEKENQCNTWLNGTAKHFIELTPECKFITAH